VTRVAAVDCGTNSIRLLIADIETGAQTGSDRGGQDAAPRLRDVVREMRVVRLGQGVDATGELAPEALGRTFAAAADYAELIRRHGAEKVRFVATSATRDAKNRQVFVDGIRELLGVEPEVITGDEEAALSFAGASSVLPSRGQDPVLVVDLGGGSTEFVLGNADGVLAARSVDVGCVRMTERHLRHDPPTPEQITAAEADVDAAIDEAALSVPLKHATAVVGVAGSVTTITAHALRLPQYSPEAIHGTELSLEVIRQACTELLEMSRAERAALPYMHPGRVDVIGAGALVWRRVLDRLAEVTDGRISTAVASEHDILDGIALSIAK
jgi:exopolyphosphatase/guanosine-5'-triphosphate,3'-diphosphate pyrophosphatase